MSNVVDTTELEQVTAVTIFGENFNIYGNINDPLFLASDVAEMIEYSPDKVGQMLDNVDDNEKLTDTIYRSGQMREMWFLTEYGLYELLMQSRKPLAKKFKLVIKNLLKQIRTGTYEPPRRVSQDRNGCYTFHNAKIIFRNFSGEASTYNRAGDRNFGIVIDDQTVAQALTNDGWAVKPLKSRDEDAEQRYFIKVTVRFDNIPPKVFKICGKVKTQLDEEAVGSLDFDELSNIDVTISPSKWDVNGNHGIKAYLKTMYVTLVEDELASKYADEELPFN